VVLFEDRLVGGGGGLPFLGLAVGEEGLVRVAEAVYFLRVAVDLDDVPEPDPL
jgi:hypothetical protein